MAVGIIMEFEGFKPENYDAVAQQINWPQNWPEGLTFHVAGSSEDGMRIVEIPSLATSGETLTIEESMNLEGENGERHDVAGDREWSRAGG